MTTFDNNIPLNPPSLVKGKGKEQQNKKQLNENQLQLNENAQQLKSTPKQSLVNTNSNIPLNRPVLISPAVNQISLNVTNLPKASIQTVQENKSQGEALSVSGQGEFKGASDLPAYAGVSNMSFKSWVANSEKNLTAKLGSFEETLTALLDAVKGFERKNYEGDESLPDADEGTKSSKIKRNLILLSHIFGEREQSTAYAPELMSNILSFKKLGRLNVEKGSEENLFYDFKSPSPPPPSVEINTNINANLNIKHLYELFALPKEFPECLRLFAGEKIEIDSNYLKSFFTQRLKFVQEKTFSSDANIGNAFGAFVSALSEKNLLLPLILLYYPLPLPQINKDFDYLEKSKKKKEEKTQDENTILASCELYYLHKDRGRFLIKIILGINGKLSVDIETAKQNNGIVRDIELSVGEGMYLLEHPPQLSELNVKLCDEIYKATDKDEQLAIHSAGPLRIEIIIAVYSALVVLNKLSAEPDPSGLIEMID